jgi:hypothetical protein
MPTTLNFHDLIDKPLHRAVSPSPSAGVAGSGICCDLRNTEDRDPHLYELISNALVNQYNFKNDGWVAGGLVNPGLAGTFGAGANLVMMPHRGPRGTLTAVASTSQFTLSTLELAITAYVNQFASTGAGGGASGPIGFKIRIYDPVAGKMGETYITSNTASTTPVVTVSPALAWTPSTSSSYEMLSGRVYFMGSGTVAAGIWKYFDIALNVMSGSLSTTNMPNLATDSAMLCMDELYVPSNQSPGVGYFGQLTATGSGASTITGTVSGADSAVATNEFRNFQIRIVQDLTNVAAVGQRRRITSHTAGASPVYTTNTAWTTQPSSSAVFVIENNNDILMWTGAQTNTYAYHEDAQPMNVTAQTWDTTTWAARGTAIGVGTMCFMPHGVSNGVVSGVTTVALYGTNDPNKNFRYSYIHSFRGGNVTTLDIFDIAGAATGAWTSAAPYAVTLNAFNTGSAGGYDGVTNNGAYYYININGGQTYIRYSAFSRNTEPWAYLKYPTSGVVVGAKLDVAAYIDPSGNPKVGFLYSRKMTSSTVGTSTELFENLISR